MFGPGDCCALQLGFNVLVSSSTEIITVDTISPLFREDNTFILAHARCN